MAKSNDKEMTPEEQAKWFAVCAERTKNYRAKKRETPEGAAKLKAKSREYSRRYRLKKKMEASITEILKKKMEAKLGEGEKLDKEKMGEIRKELEQENKTAGLKGCAIIRPRAGAAMTNAMKSAAYRARIRETPEGAAMLKERSRITSRKYRMKLKEKQQEKEVAEALLAVQDPKKREKEALEALLAIQGRGRQQQEKIDAAELFESFYGVPPANVAAQKLEGGKQQRKVVAVDPVAEAEVMKRLVEGGTQQRKVVVDPVTEAKVKKRLQESGGKKNLPIKKRALPLAYTRRKDEEVHTTITKILKGGVTDAERQAAYMALKRATPGDIIELEKTSNNEESSDDRVVAIAVAPPPLALFARNAPKMKTSRPMTGAERQAAYRARKRATKEGAIELKKKNNGYNATYRMKGKMKKGAKALLAFHSEWVQGNQAKVPPTMKVDETNKQQKTDANEFPVPGLGFTAPLFSLAKCSNEGCDNVAQKAGGLLCERHYNEMFGACERHYKEIFGGIPHKRKRVEETNKQQDPVTGLGVEESIVPLPSAKLAKECTDSATTNESEVRAVKRSAPLPMKKRKRLHLDEEGDYDGAAAGDAIVDAALPSPPSADSVTEAQTEAAASATVAATADAGLSYDSDSDDMPLITKRTVTKQKKRAKTVRAVKRSAPSDTEQDSSNTPAKLKKVGRRLCSNEGCDNVAQKADLCSRHYKEKFGVSATSNRKKCSSEECSKQETKAGLCSRHYKEKFGVSATSGRKKCSSGECSKQAQEEGLCRRHYSEKFGVVARPNKQCTHEGVCDKRSQKGGLCARHYKEKFGTYVRSQNGGKGQQHAKVPPIVEVGRNKQETLNVNDALLLRAASENQSKLTSADGLDSAKSAEGLGAKCTDNAITNESEVRAVKRSAPSDTEQDSNNTHVSPKKRGVKLCSNEGCDKQAQKEGLCSRHYREKFGVSVKANWICTHGECGNQIRKEGLCRRHLKEKLRGLKVWHQGTNEQCTHEEGCDKQSAREGSNCSTHIGKHAHEFGVSATTDRKKCSLGEGSKQAQEDGLGTIACPNKSAPKRVDVTIGRESKVYAKEKSLVPRQIVDVKPIRRMTL